MTRWRRPLTYLVVAAVVLAAWQLLTSSGLVKPLLLSPPDLVWAALGHLWQQPANILGPVGVTLRETAVAFAAAAAIATPIGLVVGSSALLRRAYEPVLTTVSAVPLIVLYPVLAATLGVGSSSKVALGALYAFFPVAIATTRAAANVDNRLVIAAEAMGATRAQYIRSVVLPATLSPLVVGMRVAVALALVTIIAAEFISGADGVGYELGTASQGLDTPSLFAWVVIACTLTIGVNVIFTLTTNAVLKGIHR